MNKTGEAHMSDKPTGHLAVAESHARACFDVLHRHVVGTPRCGCRLDEGASFPSFVMNPACLLGANALEEYELATERVIELKALSPTTPR
jgi:hypothetical protein